MRTCMDAHTHTQINNKNCADDLYNYKTYSTLLQLAFLVEKQPKFPMGEIPIGTTKC